MYRVGDEWRFDDIHSPDVADFEALSLADDADDSTTMPLPNRDPAAFFDAEARFEAIMHGNPEHNVAKIGEGPDDVQHQYLVGASNGVYMVAYQDHPELNGDDPVILEEIFTSGRDGFRKGISGDQTAYKTIKQAGHEGRETQFLIASNRGEATTRMFFVNQRWYHVLVMGTSEFVNAKPALLFLDSFKVIDSADSKKTSRDELIQKLKDF